MAIKDFLKIVPPPDEPLDGGDASKWTIVQKDFGMRMPKDLYDFGMYYGSGRFCSTFLQVYNPFLPGYRGLIDSECEIIRHLGMKSNRPCPYRTYPEQPGLFPWGRDENGGTMLWLTEGKPDNWPIILMPHGVNYSKWESSLEIVKLPLATFLARVFSNKISCRMWSKFKEKERVFTPGRSQAEVAGNILRGKK